MSKRMFAVTLVFAVSLAPLALAETVKKGAKKADTKVEATEKAPRLSVLEPIKDFGTVPKGEKLTWSFLVKNTGTADLEIINARPACGCTVAEFDKVIKPGQTGKVTAAVDTTNFAGPIAKAVTLETNDPSTPNAQITIHAIVKPYVEAYPAGFVRYNLLQGETEAQSVTLFSEEQEPFEIVKVEAPSDWVRAEPIKIENEADRAQTGRPGQNQYKLNITVGGPDAKIGPIAERIKVTTNSKHQPEYYITVSGVIRPTYRVEPTAINFGEVAPNDTAATRIVTLRSNSLKSPADFTVTKVDSGIQSVTADVKPTATKGEYEVTLQVKKDAKPGDVQGDVKIYTNDKVVPVFTVPVRGTIKAVATVTSK